jgi:hypothetical protein
MKINRLPDLEVLNELLSLDVESGNLYWKKTNNQVKVGAIAGVLRPEGYIVVMIKGKSYMAHRIAYTIHYGSEPDCLIDHIDGNRTNNNPNNLRLANHHENAQNRNVKIKNTSGDRNVYWRGDRNKWRVYISAFGKTYYFGMFDNKEDATEVAVKQRKILHGEFASG